MAAADIAPTIIAEENVSLTGKTGTAPRVRRFYIKGTKVTASDWIQPQVRLGYVDITGKIIGWTAVTVDSSNDMIIDIGTYTDSTDKLVFSSAAVGTLHVWLDVLAE